MPFIVSYGLTAGLCLAVFCLPSRNRYKDTLILLLVFCSGSASYANSRVLPASHIRWLGYKARDNICQVKGYIVDQPVFRDGKTSFMLASREFCLDRSKRNCCGKLIVNINGEKFLNCGDILLLSGRLVRPFFGAGSGPSRRKRGYADYLYDQGVYLLMKVDNPIRAIVLGQNKASLLKRFSFRLKQGIERVIYKRLSPAAAGIIDAMVLGEKKGVPPLIYRSMMKSGTVHILVVSGFNVGIVIVLIFSGLKIFRISRNIRFYLALPLMLVYCLMTGASNPVVRATIMALVLGFAYYLRREADIYNACAAAALLILVIEPRELFDIGFQLSFVSVIALVYLYPVLKRMLNMEKLKARVAACFIDSFLVSFSAWICTAGFIAYYFGMVSPVTVLANLVIVPLAGLITLLGFSLVVTNWLSAWLCASLVPVAELAVNLLIQVNFLLISLPKAYFYLR
ncbi:MAG: ComEC/Rec2 family competence protein [Candidatus Omnitrophica bacterium]|jgi:competence protein ComEC|nr:ComEC/Rec2 family competence protein [Candidatus Omnitrophota bacterium]